MIHFFNVSVEIMYYHVQSIGPNPRNTIESSFIGFKELRVQVLQGLYNTAPQMPSVHSYVSSLAFRAMLSDYLSSDAHNNILIGVSQELWAFPAYYATQKSPFKRSFVVGFPT